MKNFEKKPHAPTNSVDCVNLLSLTTYGAETNTYYVVKDLLNSVHALIDVSGQIVERYEYDAWGRTTAFNASGEELSKSVVGNRYCFQGREIDWTTGLYYFRARWYDPISGRWLSNDPVGISGGLNQYVFCSNNPVNFIDPFGLCDKPKPIWLNDGNIHENGTTHVMGLDTRNPIIDFLIGDGSPILNLLEDIIPNAHRFSVRHDSGDYMGNLPKWKFAVLNFPSMPVAFGDALLRNIADTVGVDPVPKVTTEGLNWSF